MAYTRLEAGYSTHYKSIEVGPFALAAHTAMLGWANFHKTNGWLTREVALDCTRVAFERFWNDDRIRTRRPPKAKARLLFEATVDDLISAGLLDMDAEQDLLLHDFADFNVTYQFDEATGSTCVIYPDGKVVPEHPFVVDDKVEHKRKLGANRSQKYRDRRRRAANAARVVCNVAKDNKATTSEGISSADRSDPSSGNVTPGEPESVTGDGDNSVTRDAPSVTGNGVTSVTVTPLKSKEKKKRNENPPFFEGGADPPSLEGVTRDGPESVTRDVTPPPARDVEDAFEEDAQEVTHVRARALPEHQWRLEANFLREAFIQGQETVRGRPYAFPPEQLSILRSAIQAHCKGEDLRNIPRWVEAMSEGFARYQLALERSDGTNRWISAPGPRSFSEWLNKGAPAEAPMRPGVRRAITQQHDPGVTFGQEWVPGPEAANE